MLTFTELSLRRGTRLLFSNATFGLFRGEKIGIVGENGSGKSSLLDLVRGELQPDAGSFDRPPGLSIAHVAQEHAASDAPAIELVLDGDQELRSIEAAIRQAQAHDAGMRLAELHGRLAAIGGYEARSRAARLLHGLGFQPADEQRPVATFSGGWRVRLNVARALMCRSDMLLLDEPTNHLDLDAILWLEAWLREYPGTLLLIAHDREFLDRTVGRIVSLEQGSVRTYRGNYSDYEQQRAAELAQQAALHTRQEREIRHMEAFVERFRAQATRARQAQSRLKVLERMQRIAPAHIDSPFTFRFAPPAKLPRPLLVIEDQAVGYGERALLTGVHLSIAPGDRIGLLGRNGAGKSTLVKLLAGAMVGLSGKRTEARDLDTGYFAQHQLEQLDAHTSVMENLLRSGGSAARQAPQQALRDHLAAFGFRGERVFEAVGPLSGGEKARLVLAIIAWSRPNLLLLDEPTNHLDLEMRQALAVALTEYTGAVVLVSHDRHLLRTVVDRFYVVHGGRCVPFEGDLEDYAGWLMENAVPALADTASEENAPAAVADHRTGSERAAQPRDAQSTRQRKREAAEHRNRLAPTRARMAQLEADLERLARVAADIETQLVDPALYQEEAQQRLQEILRRRAGVVQETQVTEAAWLEAAELLEAQRMPQ